MLLKWVFCDVTDEAAFGAGQAGWSALRALPGFLGQAGGWSTAVPGRAHLFGWWRDRAAYTTFMATAHDRLAASQAGSYRGIEVRLFDQVLGSGWPAATLASAEAVRLAHGPAHPGVPSDFVRHEHTPPGLLGRVVATSDTTEVLLLDVWRAARDVPPPPGTVLDLISLVPDWTVTPPHG